jgi:hypothetical protein
MRVNTAANVDGHIEPPSQDFGNAGCVFDARW